LRLAEEVATLDHISAGRLILGVGRSGISTFVRGLRRAVRRKAASAFAEVLEILQRSFRHERFSFTGKFYTFSDIGVVRGHRRACARGLRVGRTTTYTYAAIGAMGLPIFRGRAAGHHRELRVRRSKAYPDPPFRAAGHAGKAGFTAGTDLCRR